MGEHVARAAPRRLAADCLPHHQSGPGSREPPDVGEGVVTADQDHGSSLPSVPKTGTTKSSHDDEMLVYFSLAVACGECQKKKPPKEYQSEGGLAELPLPGEAMPPTSA